MERIYYRLPYVIKNQELSSTWSGEPCQGDSGGPLTVSQQPHAHHVLVGITSYGLECGKKGQYGIYSKISFYRDWIQSNMKSPVVCSE